MMAADAAVEATTGVAVQVGEQVLTLRNVQPDDRDAVLALHTEVFESAVDAAWFAWKYGLAPGQGHGHAAGVWHGQRLIAYCGGVPRTLWQRDQPFAAMQMGDVMVHPAWRGILTRRGAFFYVTQFFHSTRVGHKKDKPFQLGFGFPNERAMRLPVKLGLVWDGGTMETLHWYCTAVGTPDLPPLWRWIEMHPFEAKFERACNLAWRKMRTQMGGQTLGQRDAAYLRWRYVDRPPAPSRPVGAAPRYRFFELRRPWSRSPAGVAVLEMGLASAHWLDWVGPMALMPLANLACRLEARRNGADELTAWASTAVAWQLEKSGISRREVCAGIGVSASSDLRHDDVAGLQWWLMGGDTDFL